MSLLFGQRVLLSQTQAFDGLYFLKFAQGKHSDSFLKLIKGGFVQIHLQAGKPGKADGFPHEKYSHPPSLRKLLISKIADHGFHLTAWRDIPQVDADTPSYHVQQREELRRVLEEMLDGNPKSLKSLDLPDLEAGWDALRRVDNACAEALATGHSPEQHMIANPARRESLDEGIASLAHGPLVSPAVRGHLLETARLRTNVRSAYHKKIKADEMLTGDEKVVAHELVNGEYNRVVAHSLQTVPHLVATSSKGGDALQGDGKRYPAVKRVVEEAPEYAGQLEGLGWSELYELLYHLEISKDDPVDKAKYINDHVAYAAKEVHEFQGNKWTKFVINEAAAETVAAAGHGIGKAFIGLAGDTILAHTGVPVPFSFLMSHSLYDISKPMVTALFTKMTGHKPSIEAMTKEFITHRSLDHHEAEIINIVKQHPGAPDLPLP